MIETYAYVYLWYDKLYKWFYLGYTNGKDPYYKGSGKNFKKEYKKRPNDFKRRLLAKSLNILEMRALEDRLIEIRKSRFGISYYNMPNGGGGVISHTDKVKKVISEAKIKNWQDPKYKKKKLKDGFQSGEKHFRFGKSLSKEHKESMSKIMKTEYSYERTHTSESRKKRSQAQLGRVKDPLTRKWKRNPDGTFYKRTQDIKKG